MQLLDAPVLFLSFQLSTITFSVMGVWALIKVVQSFWKNDAVDTSNLTEKLDDIKGQPAAVKEMKSQVKIFAKLKKNKNIQVQHILLYGPPGVGKTMMARAFANEVGVPFYAESSVSLTGQYIGHTENNIKNIYRQAKSHQPSVLFIDEFDSLGVKRSIIGVCNATNSHNNSVTNALLAEMDGFDQNQVMVIAATNDASAIDDALYSRFQVKIEMKELNAEALRDVARSHICKLFKAGSSLDLKVQGQYESARDIKGKVQHSYNEFATSEKTDQSVESFIKQLAL
jgi:AAA+ superfamily predicted ATPase